MYILDLPVDIILLVLRDLTIGDVYTLRTVRCVVLSFLVSN